MPDDLYAGAAAIDVSPRDTQFLFGYPYVRRYSTGIHDPLLASALFLNDGHTHLLIIAVDIIFVSKATTARVRQRIAKATGLEAGNILITATHTHSGPITVDCLSNADDPIIPKTDPRCLKRLEDGIVQAGRQACAAAAPAEIGLEVADGTGVGTNRRDPAGPRDPQVPVLLLRSLPDHRPLAAMLVYSMHPTVLHEDSTLVSGDFPAMTRQYLQEHVLGRDCVVLYHTGPAGNQSPRHVTHGNTFAEAERLGQMLGQAVAKVTPGISYVRHAFLACAQEFVNPPLRQLPGVAQALTRRDRVLQKLESLRHAAAPRTEVRTAECDWFGAEETLTLAQAAMDGRLISAAAACLPVEVQVLTIGPWAFVAWPGEMFVEFALQVKERAPNAFVISMANGELQGYIVTHQAFEEGGYEASNSLFQCPEAGDLLVTAAQRLIAKLRA